MVMHARKLPRLNDGYFERNQTHPYQGTGKYSGKSNYNERYNDKVRESPSNGSSYRSESPDSQHSPRDRSYHNKSSYSQRVKDRERERHDREASRSPKEKAKAGREHHPSSSHRNTDNAEYRSNHDRNSTEDKERRIQVGDWSEHISSSGKKYYYNCKTEISQWEKPKEWIEWERQQGKTNSEIPKVKERNYEKSSSSSSSSTNRSSEKHSSSERSSRTSSSVHHHHHSRTHDERHHFKSSGGSSSSSSVASSRSYIANEHGHKNSQLQPVRNENHLKGTERTEHRENADDSSRREGERRADSRKNSEDSQMQDMDISPDSTPTSSSQSNSQARTQTPVATQASQPATSQASVSIASLPKLLSQLACNKGLPSLDKTELSAQEALQTLHRALLLTRQVSLTQTSTTNQCQQSSTNAETSPFLSQKSPLPVPMPSHAAVPVVVVSTPSQQNDSKGRLDEERDRTGRTSPGSEYSHRSSRRGSPTSSVSSLHSITPTGTTSTLASAALRPAAPLLTPSLANYFRDDLIGHVTGWQADHAERQANRYSEDAHSVGSLSSTKVSAELKMARSLVRVAEIQATLQEQRKLFLRQQIKELEEWKSQNSFMSVS